MATSCETPAISDAEYQARVDLAACYRLAAHYKMTDLIYTHITARVPDEPGHFLINPYGFMWEEITASSLVKIDVEGNKAASSPYRVNPAGFTIHSAVHTGRSDAHWVMHTHTRSGVAVSCLADGLLPTNQIALQFHGRLGYHDYEGVALNLGERERIVASLGSHPALVLRNHGLLTVGPSAAQMFSNMFNLCRACEIQESALAMGLPLQELDEATMRRATGQIDQMAYDDGDVQLEWDAHMRLLDRLDPGFRD
ncbi:class II aldolase/adducin family protein [Novosphingobium beihaiensis]|uniref:Class II aldolase/adducin family protein n=1 Tax=Novosphingobium beihaiensis TaxID=2930389 RepID=A0ABT0BRI2_9SPHN|nr:class II aldolase/adducin family protein [Novosphingobium beihaiensis]MCJ2187654.1 class II aldolase/adducin family protein [Novosphingobium beihaiensis]